MFKNEVSKEIMKRKEIKKLIQKSSNFIEKLMNTKTIALNKK